MNNADFEKQTEKLRRGIEIMRKMYGNRKIVIRNNDGSLVDEVSSDECEKLVNEMIERVHLAQTIKVK